MSNFSYLFSYNIIDLSVFFFINMHICHSKNEKILEAPYPQTAFGEPVCTFSKKGSSCKNFEEFPLFLQ